MRIPRLLVVPVLAVSMVAFANPASAATTVQVDGDSGTLTFTAPSAAPYVQFYFDGAAAGTPVATSGGSASTPFESWGYSNDNHDVRAAECTDTANCDAAGVATTVLLKNAAPAITSPSPNAHVLGGFHVTATSGGGGLQYSVDGTRFDFDAASPYDGHYQGRALSPGTHTVTVTQCNTAGTMCTGPGAVVDVVADALDPAITGLAPSPFRPGHRRTTLSYTIQDPEDVSVTVRDPAGNPVRGPLDLGTLAGGTHSWSWAGNTNTGPVAPSGRYRIVLATSRDADGVTVHGKTAKFVVLDRTAPTLTHVSGAGKFYPVRDGYRDVFTAGTRLSESAIVTLHVTTAGGRPVRTITAARKPGRAALTWNGRSGSGRLLPAGTYRWYLTARDAAGNTTRSAVSAVTVSSSRLVSHVVSLEHNGAEAVSTAVSDHSCGEASRGNSDYPNGLWLVNGCYQSGSAETVAAMYRFIVPRATRYDRFTTTVDGYSLFAPSRVHAAYRNAVTRKWDDGALVTIRNNQKALHGLGSRSGAQHVGSGRVVVISVVVDNAHAPCDLDVARLLLRLRFSVLTA